MRRVERPASPSSPEPANLPKKLFEEIGKIVWQWVSALIIECLQNRADQFRQVCSSRRDGVTIRVSLSRVPGMDNLPLISQGKVLQGLLRPGWMRGVPGVEITTLPGRSLP